MANEQKCVLDKSIPCCDAKKILMFRDYVKYVVANNLPFVFYTGGDMVGVCCVPSDWCPHYNEHRNKPKCRYNADIICDRKYQLEEFYRQKSEADKAGKSYSFNADGKCPAIKDMCARYLDAEKQR